MKTSSMQTTNPTNEIAADILNAALQIAENTSWEMVSIRKIAKTIRISPPLIYKHFRNKEAILLKIADDGFKVLTRIMERTARSAATPADALQQAWLGYWNFTITQSALYRIMMGIGLDSLHRTLTPGTIIDMLVPVESILRTMSNQDEKATAHESSYLLWAYIHGLAALRMTGAKLPENSYSPMLALTIRKIANCQLDSTFHTPIYTFNN